MTIDAAKAVALLDEIRGDPEGGHIEAEDIILNFLIASGHPDVAEAFRRAKERNGFWYA